jgi:hypothetical protein
MTEPADAENARCAPVRLTVAIALALGLCGAQATEPAPAADVPVQETADGAPPPGIDIGNGVTLSGYATVQLLAPFGSGVTPPPTVPPGAAEDSQYTQRARLDLSHLSGIAWWTPTPAWKLLGEIDVQDTLQLPGHLDREDGGDAAGYVSLERLYADYRVADSLSLRAGKFLTPIGRWNQEHSDPQTWTVLRPLISQSAFPTNVTGLMAFGSAPVGSQWLDYQLYGASGGEWRYSPRMHPFDSAAGVRLASTLDPHLQVGFSAARFDQSDFPRSTFHLLGMDATWSWQRAEISAEGIARQTGSGEAGEEHGWFVQAALPVSERWWIVSRVEAYKRAIDTATHASRLVGAVYKRGSRWVFKVEWVDPSPDAVGLPAGLLASLTLAY